MCDMLQLIRDSGHVIMGVDTVSGVRCSAARGGGETTRLVQARVKVAPTRCPLRPAAGGSDHK